MQLIFYDTKLRIFDLHDHADMRTHGMAFVKPFGGNGWPSQSHARQCFKEANRAQGKPTVVFLWQQCSALFYLIPFPYILVTALLCIVLSHHLPLYSCERSSLHCSTSLPSPVNVKLQCMHNYCYCYILINIKFLTFTTSW